MKIKNGFTAVELMVTLFVASLFIMSGYQLFALVSLKTANSREMSEASNIGYEVLRSEGMLSSPVSTACSSSVGSHPTQTVTRNVPTLPNANITIKRCKPFTGSSIVRVTVTVKYGNASPKREVVHATYMSAS